MNDLDDFLFEEEKDLEEELSLSFLDKERLKLIKKGIETLKETEKNINLRLEDETKFSLNNHIKFLDSIIKLGDLQDEGLSEDEEIKECEKILDGVGEVGLFDIFKLRKEREEEENKNNFLSSSEIDDAGSIDF